ncbi:hypothetical protein TgHK011_008334 [Trichoderma gracile]|nr:hypothetical protein TgHK011_008334 [Trichoderma gracile]
MLGEFSTKDGGFLLSAHAVLPHLGDYDSTIKSAKRIYIDIPLFCASSLTTAAEEEAFCLLYLVFRLVPVCVIKGYYTRLSSQYPL